MRASKSIPGQNRKQFVRMLCAGVLAAAAALSAGRIVSGAAAQVKSSAILADGGERPGATASKAERSAVQSDKRKKLAPFAFATYDGTGSYRDGNEIPALYCMIAPGFGMKGPWQRLSGPTPDSGWRHGGVTWGFPIRIGGTIYVYAEGYPGNGNDGNGCAVGAFESADNGATWKEYPGNPVFPAFYDGMDPGPGVPYIIYDPADRNPARRFKMYMANHGAGWSTYSVVAFSPSGLPDSWKMYTDSEGKPVRVISISGGDTQVTPYCIVQDGAQLRMFCVAYSESKGFYDVEYTSPRGDGIHWSRQSVSLLPKRGTTTTLAEAREGDQVLVVADPGVFTIGEIVVYEGDDFLEVNRITAIDPGMNKIMLERPVMKMDLRKGSRIYSIAFNCVFPSGLYKMGSYWFGFADCLGSIGKYTFDYCIPIAGVTPESVTYDWLRGFPLDPMQHTDETRGGISPIPIDEALRYITIDR